MPNVTLTIEDVSPLIVYSERWVAGSSANDPLLERYSQANYMTVDASGELATFVFTGNRVELFGAKRPNYGQYQVTVNDEVYQGREANSDTDEFQMLLWVGDWEKAKPRTVKYATLGGGRPIDLDFIRFSFPVGRPDEEVVVHTFQDTDPSFVYEPDDHWERNATNVASFSGGTGRAANCAGDSFAFTFEGDAVSLYGPVGPTGARFRVVIESQGLPDELTTNKPFWRTNTLLYHKADLGPGRHTINVTVLPESNEEGVQRSFAIDYAEVYTSGQSVSSTPGSAGLSAGAAAGIALAGVLLALGLILGILIWSLVIYARRKGRVLHFGFIDPEKPAEAQNTIQPFQYTTVDSASPPPTTSGDPLLRTHTSNNSIAATPMTSQWPPSTQPLDQAVVVNDPAIRPIQSVASLGQEVVIPPHGYQKSRAPQLQPPPQGVRSRLAPAAQGAALQGVSPVTEERTLQTGGANSSFSFYTQESPPMYSMNDPSTPHGPQSSLPRKF
ncbi:hypothetical protein CC1G_03310 [Coprinopsis cinerea okayama7|uniref:Transmembrane protein n=1 Tax=Coprinopsis cinerea (strain Okayama-7 / 130 / ATCC MYA-4618 / FGSC 9003) TaxID=240176 RepID=A8N7G7_COPC7|nr:hypothetical protein CC1G_03310 [Coprinopsis cinerea okayama7\|eukprot:XP_001830773.2 hypothetical protein CC1G_03310 [Coprinopsis cinerea okayama7\